MLNREVYLVYQQHVTEMLKDFVQYEKSTWSNLYHSL